MSQAQDTRSGVDARRARAVGFLAEQSETTPARIRFADDQAIPTLAYGLSIRNESGLQDPVEVAGRFVESNAKVLGAVDPVTVRKRSVFVHDGLTHVTFHQFVESLRVLDAIYAVTLDAGRQIIATSGRLYGDTTVRGSFSLGEEDAIVRAAPGQLALREEFSVERAVMGHGNELRYVFLVTGSHGESVVDAETGQVLARREGR